MDTSKKYEEEHFVDSTKPVWNYSLFTDEDLANFRNGTHYSLYKLFGSHAIAVLGQEGYYFAVWAPNATKVNLGVRLRAIRSVVERETAQTAG